MTEAEAKKVSIGDVVFRVDCFGDYWKAKVVEGKQYCVGNWHKEVGIENINEFPSLFARTLEDARQMSREAKAEYGAAVFGW